MTYTFPPSLYPLRDYLKGQGADTRAVAIGIELARAILQKEEAA